MKPPLPLPPPPRMEPLARDPRNYRRHVDAVLGAAERRACAARRLRRALVLAIIGAVVALLFIVWAFYAPVPFLLNFR